MNEPEARIMVVDNEPFNAAMIQYSLESKGFRALVVEAGQDPLKMIAAFEPHLVILGVPQAGRDGFQTFHRIHDHSPVPIILVGARAEGHEKAEGLMLGADDFLTMPVRSAELIARIRAVLRRVQYAKRDKACSFFRVPS